MADENPQAPPDECQECGHSLPESPEPGKGHAKRGQALICKTCGSVCRVDVPAATAGPAPSVTPRAPESTEELADALVKKMGKIRNEVMWYDVHSPGCVLQAVDGGFIIADRHGRISVRTTLDEALARVREWMAPP